MKVQTNSIETTNHAMTITNLGDAYHRFIAWANRMDYYRLMILVGTILLQGCITVPFGMWSMEASAGTNDIQMLIIIIGSFTILVTNLSVQPMRITIPLCVISTLAQFGVIAVNVIGLF